MKLLSGNHLRALLFLLLTYSCAIKGWCKNFHAPLNDTSGVTGIVPAVQQWRPQQGYFNVEPEKVIIAVNIRDNNKLKTVSANLKADLTPLGFPHIEIIQSNIPLKGSIFLTLSSQTLPNGKESHRIRITSTQVVITGNSVEAIHFGARSVLQMVRAHAGNIPCGEVKDWPSYSRRMLMIDVGRKPWPLEVLKDYVRILSWHKMNELHLHLSDEAFGESYSAIRVQSDVFPQLAAKDLCYSKQEIKELVSFAKGYGIVITPEFDMPGHAAAFTNYFPDCMLKGYPNYLDVSNPKTLTIMKKFVDEMIPLFDAPDFHIGTDEYRVKYPPEEKEKLHQDFRRFINSMNAHIRSKGKNCRIWSGYESMMGKSVSVDSTVIVDMWDPYHDEHNGHLVINSSQYVSYYVPGCHYYGVNPEEVYNKWEPWQAGENVNKPQKNSPRLLGGKLHIWCDQGPTGYTMTEIADLVIPGIQAFAEKLWGTKGSASYDQYLNRSKAILPVSNVTVLNRLELQRSPSAPDVVLNIPNELELTSRNAIIDLPLAHADRADLEYPWTLSVDLKKLQTVEGKNVFLSSDLVELCGNYSWKQKEKIENNGQQNEQIHSGIGIVRAAGARQGTGSPAETYLSHDVSNGFEQQLPLNQWTNLTIVAFKGGASVYINGQKIGETNNQILCPLRHIGSNYGDSFVGKIRNLKVWNRNLSNEEIENTAVSNAKTSSSSIR
ncbi:family 20 glycosylhydrolase [Solitalea lacus]|uniref:family 20 glycosylhydrolase n=1 Tax=Solitalea lacus TaxID=2911172 RepID=UPI001EDAF54C|nr:family 20 glycosylhydrolase [Solitalea lacus]UKJ09243.1 family 20 glycosylhydrolase [Solitalea lacus]